jgi:hypothetical protein
MNNLPAITGWIWLKRGASLFRQQPAALTTLLFANILISILISSVPLLGPMVAVVLIPSFSMAFMMGCSMIESGQRVSPAVLLTGFRKPVFRELCKVGVVYLAVSLVLALITRLAVDETFWEQVRAQGTTGTPAVLAGSDVLAMFLIFALCFAAPLTYWQKMPPFKAVFYSFFAVKRSAGVFLVLLLAWFAIFFAVCMVIAMLLGGNNIARVVIMWVIFLFILLLQCAMYAGYREIFGKPDTAPADKVSLEK